MFIVKVLGTDKGTALRAYGALEEVEAALYLFGDLLSALDEEIKKLKKEGYKITKDSFVIGACPEMEKKLRMADTSSDNALVTLQNENKEKAKRLCFSEYGIRRTYSKKSVDPTSMSLGQEFGKSMDISSSIGRKEIKG